MTPEARATKLAAIEAQKEERRRVVQVLLMKFAWPYEEAENERLLIEFGWES